MRAVTPLYYNNNEKIRYKNIIKKINIIIKKYLE